jgi:hypothetical protein
MRQSTGGAPGRTDVAVLTCEECGGVIGMYEPMVVRVGEDVRETSAAAEPNVAELTGERFHRACFAPHGHGHGHRREQSRR